jgi:hypothetical protein
MVSRFDTGVDVDAILASQYKPSTLRNDKYAKSLLKNFCELKQFNFDSQVFSDWDSLLSDFYASVKKSDGSDFNSSSLISIRYSISRIIKKRLNVDIATHDAFKRSASVHKAMLRHLKSKGNGITKHFDVICEEDLQKIGKMPTNSPVLLQWRNWFNIMLHFMNRGRENVGDLKKEDVLILKNNEGKQYLKLRDFQTKNHQGLSVGPSTEAILMETRDSNCPVAMFQLYVSKLHTVNPFLWQKPKVSFTEAELSWYTNKKIGINNVSKFMSQISNYLKLSKIYTNHCIRATAITVLGKNAFQDTEIAAFSGHKSLSSLAVYKRTSENVKESMSSALHQSIFASNTACSSSEQPIMSPSTDSFVQSATENCENLNIITPIVCKNNSSTASSMPDATNHSPLLSLDEDLYLNQVLDKYESHGDMNFQNMFNSCSINNVYIIKK